MRNVDSAMLRAVPVLLSLIAMTSSLAGRQNSQPPKIQSVEKLIEQLGNEDFEVRDAASKAIEQLGPEALPVLRVARNHPDPEIRRRVEKWIPEFELAAFVAPRRITLDAKSALPGSVIEELARQSGYKLKLTKNAAASQKPLNLKLDHVTFWEAFDRISAEREVILGAGDGVWLNSNRLVKANVIYHRAFRLAPTGPITLDNSRPKANEKHESAGLIYQLEFRFVPKWKSKGRVAECDFEDVGCFELEDAKGNRYEMGSRSLRVRPAETWASIWFDPSPANATKPGPPTKLIFRWSESLVYHVPFEFKDLPLP